VHKIVGEIYVEQLNAKNGLLGRPVEWIVRDDQSKPDLARTLYEQLITVDKVDLLMGPYATGAILSAMAVAQRYDKLLIHHTFGIPNMAKYERQFPAWSMGPEPQDTVPNTVLDALAASPKPPKTIAVVTSKFPSVHFVALGAREVAKKRGLKEVLFLEWEFGNRDYGPIAARIKEANADFLWVGALGLEGNQLIDAMKKIDYMPKEQFYMYPAPGPIHQGLQ
jgi:branched-chain amino acid transport system substrate-binding protein